MTQPTVIPLASAYICGDLERTHITDNPYRCPQCGSHVTPLWAILNREPEQEETMLEVHG